MHENVIETIDPLNVNDRNIDKAILYHGDYNLITRAKQFDEDNKRVRPLAAAVLGLNNTGIPIPDDSRKSDCWVDTDAHETYLNTKPQCYLILGNSGLGHYSLGEALSKKLNCLHLCPKSVLMDEIEQKSPTGKCIDFNMRHNHVCKFDIIFKILERKLQSQAVKHRGFIISGFPLITSNQVLDYKINTFNVEESLLFVEEIMYDLIYNLKRKKRTKKSSSLSSIISEEISVEEEAEEEQEQENEDEKDKVEIVELPKYLLDSCSNVVFSKKTYFTTLKCIVLRQIQTIFDFKPDIIIYISSPNSDTVTKRSRKYLNYITSSKTFNAYAVNTEFELRWPSNYVLSDYNKPFVSNIFNPKYNCLQPINFKQNATNQICNFKDHVSYYLENKLKDFDPKLVIKLDGRTSVHQMTHNTMERLLMLPIKPVLIPEPLYLDEPPEDIDEFWKTVEELNVIRTEKNNFNRYASVWYNRCPVELEKRRTVQGKPKLAVTFFKHVYLLSSLDAMISFCRNPRPYLKLHYLEPTCRIIVSGTKSSGKTLIAKCLSWLFDAPVICYSQILIEQTQNKYLNYSKTILSEIIAIIEDKRLAKWEHDELERVSKLNTWFNTMSSILGNYIKLLKVRISQITEGMPDNEAISSNKYRSLRDKLSFLPFLDDLESCELALSDQNLLKYAPLELTTGQSKPSIPLLGDDDVTTEITEYISANELQKEIEPTTKELMDEIIKIIESLDSESLKSSGKYGKFIIDGFPSYYEFWDYLIERYKLPDYTIVLFENREIDTDLFQNYKTVAKSVKNYQERYISATDTLIKTKLSYKEPEDTTVIDMEIIINDIISDVLDQILQQDEDKNTISDADVIQTFTEAIEKFREDWESLKLKLDENFKSFIEVEIEEKDDLQIIDEVLLKLRMSYSKGYQLNEDEGANNDEIDDDTSKSLLTFNDSRFLNETSVYCPVAFYDFGVLWEGKPEISVKCNNKNYYFCKEECFEKFQRDLTKYQFYNLPMKNIPPIRICIIGSTGSGKTSVAKQIAKELGLLHVDFADYINNVLIPKHFKKVGWKYENSFTDPPLDEETIEFQLDEENLNLVSDILSNEQELRRLVNNYFEHGMPLLSVLMQKIIKKLWFEDPFQYIGTVIDGFPKINTDVEDMVACYCIPDIVIELEGNSDTTLNRLSSKYFKIWKIQRNEAKTKADIQLQKKRDEWLYIVSKSIVVKLIIDDILASIFVDDNELDKTLSTQSTVIDADPSGSSNVDPNLFATFNEFIQEYPEPIDRNEWEKADDVLEKINARLENMFERDDENIQTLKDALYDQNIKVESIDGRQPLEKVLRKTLLKLSNVRNRSESFLEQTFLVNYDIAEMLLLEGFFLISKFYRMCPVFIYENPYAIFSPYNLSKHLSKLFPVIHRSYIYFIASENSVIKFRSNPLKYINSDAISKFCSYPLKIAVIGPPKSGKSKLVSKLAKRYGLMSVSKGMAIRYIVENMHWTEIGSKLISKLREGECVDNELIMKAVLFVLMDCRTMNHGFVLNGFPETPFEACQLLKDGIFPIIVFDINSSLGTVLRNCQCEIYYDILKRKPPYPSTFIEYRFKSWLAASRNVRDWFNQDTQNIYYINGKNSKWKCYLDAYKLVESLVPKIHNYLINVGSGIVSVDIFGISNEEFNKRMSNFKNICPICLSKNIYRNSSIPPDRKGLVQYRDLFYWICPDHLNYVMQYPENILKSNDLKLPDLPARVKYVDASLLYEHGTCLVTYAENLPSQIIVSGKNKFAANYKGKIYLFCNDKCLNKFMVKPYLFYDITVFKEMKIFPEVSLKNLPNLGYLEQTVGNIMTEACCAVNVARPKYPGLDTGLSALLYIALYLKTHNPLLDEAVLALYEKALKIFDCRSKLIVEVGLRLRSVTNPFSSYPKCCERKKQKTIVTVQKSSIISSSTDSEYNKLDSPF